MSEEMSLFFGGGGGEGQGVGGGYMKYSFL